LCLPLIPALQRWKKKHHEFEASIGYGRRPCLKKKKKRKFGERECISEKTLQA
jgi:hypothetical protein